MNPALTAEKAAALALAPTIFRTAGTSDFLD
jgi:hypothetical protein